MLSRHPEQVDYSSGQVSFHSHLPNAGLETNGSQLAKD